MSDDATDERQAPFEPAPASPGEAWVLAADVVGWVDGETIERADALQRAMNELEARSERLSTEIERAMSDARAAGLADGREAVAALVDTLESWKERVTERAALAAAEVATALVGEHFAVSRDDARRRIERVLGASAATPERVIVAPAIAEIIGATVLGQVPVIPDPRLACGDVIIETADGKRESRLAALVALAEDDVLAALRGVR